MVHCVGKKYLYQLSKSELPNSVYGNTYKKKKKVVLSKLFGFFWCVFTSIAEPFENQ